MLANAAVWLGLGGYLFLLSVKQNRMTKRIQQMEMLNK